MPADEIARNFSGEPLLLVSSKLIGPGENAALGFQLLLVEISDAGVRLFRDPATAEFVEIAQLPADLLAIIAPATEAEYLRAAWAERGLTPPVIVVEELSEAREPILACARAELAKVSARCAELQSALVSTRMEFEETRVAMQGVMRTISHRYAMKMNLVATVAPSPGRTVQLSVGKSVFQAYPVVAESVTCLALHVAAVDLSEDAILTLVMSGVESGRVLGEWKRRGKAVSAGWNTFNLPIPAFPARETIAITVGLDGAAADAVFLSLSDDVVPGAHSPLAIKIWTADAGGRFPHAPDWVWSGVGQTRPAEGTASFITDDILRTAAFEGALEISHGVPGETSALVIGGGSSAMCLRDVSIPEAEALFMELRASPDDVRLAQFELMLQTPSLNIATGPRSFAESPGIMRLGLSLPAALPDKADIYLRIEDSERPPGDLATVEIRTLAFISGQRATLALAASAPRINPPPVVQRRVASPGFSGLTASNFVESEKFALFEVALSDFSFGSSTIASAKLKISMVKGRLSLEFRQGPRWPVVFEDWPGENSDRFGDVFHVTHSGEKIQLTGQLRSQADREFLASLSSVLPQIVTMSVRRLLRGSEKRAAWVEAARAFAVEAQGAFGNAHS